MGGLSIWHWLLVLAVVLLLFGGSGKISSIMSDIGKGIKSLRKGLVEDEPAPPARDPFKKHEPKSLETAGRHARLTVDSLNTGDTNPRSHQ